MDVSKLTVAVDGFSSTGKSTFAKLVAKEFGLLYLDSGALYRAVTLFAVESGLIDADNTISDSLASALGDLDIHFGTDGRTYIGARCIEKEIRSLEISSRVSPVSALPYVRAFVDDRLHRFGAGGGIVMDGRDIGSTVFPNAEIKIFMTASEEVRARRRYDEMVSKGESPTIEAVTANLRERDYIDSHREASPLTRASDAFVLDNSSMSLEEEICWIKGLIQGKIGLLEL
ncbi:MAG: (d)CMP kinase [Bacteroidales bacterium]|nr:(d)CMP kinase [Bacteroidales bacterium]